MLAVRELGYFGGGRGQGEGYATLGYSSLPASEHSFWRATLFWGSEDGARAGARQRYASPSRNQSRPDHSDHSPDRPDHSDHSDAPGGPPAHSATVLESAHEALVHRRELRAAARARRLSTG